MNVDFKLIREQIRAFRFESKDPKDWQLFFDTAIQLLDCKSREMKNDAINRICTGLWSESNRPYRGDNFLPAPEEQRLPPILEALAKQADDFEFCITQFAHYASLDSAPKSRAIFESWLNDISDSKRNPHIHTNSILLAKLESSLFPAKDAEEAMNFILPCLSHESAAVRASAAGALGKLYDEDFPNLPPLSEMLDHVKAWDVERPGVAGPFWGMVRFDTGLSEFDATGWMLNILEHRKGEEPSFYCHNGIDFYAHEQMCANVSAIRKLIDINQEEIAALAATEIQEPLEGMEDLLIELGNSSDDLVCRTCCWHLAYNYRYLHLKGKDKGFVAFEPRSDGDVFLVFSDDKILYAATVYAKNDSINDSTAMLWLDRLLPLLGKLPLKKSYKTAHQITFDFGSSTAILYGDTENKLWNRIWVGRPVPTGW